MAIRSGLPADMINRANLRSGVAAIKIELRDEVWRQGLEWYLPVRLSTPRTDDMRQMMEDIPIGREANTQDNGYAGYCDGNE